MKVRSLVRDTYEVVAVTDDNECPVENFLAEGEESTRASREGLTELLMHVAEKGLQNIPSAWVHEADKKRKVREFVKGSLRLFFFNGEGIQIAVCVVGTMKKGQKADKASVNRTAKCRKDYFEAIANNNLEVERNED